MNKIVNGVANDYEFPELDWVHHDSKTFDDEKFIEDIERKYIEKHTTHIKVYREEYVNKLRQQIDNLNNVIRELTNNWNELEDAVDNEVNYYIEDEDAEWFEAKKIQNIMKEIKENNK